MVKKRSDPQVTLLVLCAACLVKAGMELLMIMLQRSMTYCCCQAAPAIA
jgi:hypothetical protein